MRAETQLKKRVRQSNKEKSSLPAYVFFNAIPLIEEVVEDGHDRLPQLALLKLHRQGVQCSFLPA